MTAEVNIPDEAVKLAAEHIRVEAAATCQEAELLANVAGSAEDWMGEARAALDAAAPLIVAPYESKLTDVWVLAERAERKGYDLDAAEVLAALRGETR